MSNSELIDGPDDSVGRRDAQESIRRAAEAQCDCEHGYYAAGGTALCPVCEHQGEQGEPLLSTPTERALFQDCRFYKSERDRHRRALERLRDLAAEGGNMDDALWYRRLTKALDA